MKSFIALISGLLFGFGLTVSQMVDPNKVLNFLDIFGQWDASLIFVMVGALIVFATVYQFVITKREQALLGETISTLKNSKIDSRLILGAVFFGVGWGITGICPGPAIANLSGVEPKILAFVSLMVVGMQISEWCKRRFLI